MELNKSKTESLRQKLRVFQETTGLSIKDFCAKIDVHHNTFSKILNGHKQSIDALLIGKIILQYDVNAKWFFSEDEKMYTNQKEDELAIKNQNDIINLLQAVEDVVQEMKELKKTIATLQQKIKTEE